MAVDEKKMKNTILSNLSASELVDIALERKEGVLASNQALNVTTGVRTGRSPKDRFIVKDATGQMNRSAARRMSALKQLRS